MSGYYASKTAMDYDRNQRANNWICNNLDIPPNTIIYSTSRVVNRARDAIENNEDEYILPQWLVMPFAMIWELALRPALTRLGRKDAAAITRGGEYYTPEASAVAAVDRLEASASLSATTQSCVPPEYHVVVSWLTATREPTAHRRVDDVAAHGALTVDAPGAWRGAIGSA